MSILGRLTGFHMAQNRSISCKNVIADKKCKFLLTIDTNIMVNGIGGSVLVTEFMLTQNGLKASDSVLLCVTQEGVVGLHFPHWHKHRQKRFDY